jgi:hypothetical protein
MFCLLPLLTDVQLLASLVILTRSPIPDPLRPRLLSQLLTQLVTALPVCLLSAPPMPSLGARRGLMLLFILVCLILYTQVFFSSTTLADKSNLLWSSAESALPTTAMPHLVPDITVAPPRHSASAQSSPSSAPIPATPSDASVQTSPPSSAPSPAPPTSTDPPKPAPPSSSLDAIIDPDSGKYEYGRPLFTQDFPSPPSVDTSVMIFVMSSRDNFSARQLIRQTWAKGHSNVYFLLGAACPLTPAECAPYRCGRLTVAEINGGPSTAVRWPQFRPSRLTTK